VEEETGLGIGTQWIVRNLGGGSFSGADG